MKAYIISLNKPIEKIEYLEQQGIKPILVEGINGNKLSGEEIKNRVSKSYFYLGPKSAIGCALSHFKAWKAFLETDEEYAMIFEDDVILEDDFIKKTKNSLKYVPNNYDILYLGCFGCDNKKTTFFDYVSIFVSSKNVPHKINEYISIPKIAFATHAYIISRKGAIKILNILDGNLYEHIDISLQDLSSKGQINAYVTTPRLAYQTSTDNTISENVSTKHPMILSKLLNRIYIDKKVRGDYPFLASSRRIWKYNMCAFTYIFLFIGIILTYYNVSIKNMTIFFLLISILDLCNLKSFSQFEFILFHYFIYICFLKSLSN